MSVDADKLPYRRCVGIAVFNAAGAVWVGRRIAAIPSGGGENLAHYVWQMPQGGIDDGEAPLAAARRELYEETGIRSVRLLGESNDWLHYDLPAHLVGTALKGNYRGQKMKWFAFLFEGPESEITPAHPAGGLKAEFDDWRWMALADLPAIVVPFKRPVYDAVAAAFAPFAG